MDKREEQLVELLANLDEEILYDVLDDFMGSVDVREVPEGGDPPPPSQQHQQQQHTQQPSQQQPSTTSDTILPPRNDKDANFYGQRHDHELVLINKQIQGGTDVVVCCLIEHVPVGSPKKKEAKADKKHKAMKVHLDIKSARGLSRAGGWVGNN